MLYTPFPTVPEGLSITHHRRHPDYLPWTDRAAILSRFCNSVETKCHCKWRRNRDTRWTIPNSGTSQPQGTNARAATFFNAGHQPLSPMSSLIVPARPGNATRHFSQVTMTFKIGCHRARLKATEHPLSVHGMLRNSTHRQRSTRTSSVFLQVCSQKERYKTPCVRPKPRIRLCNAT